MKSSACVLNLRAEFNDSDRPDRNVCVPKLIQPLTLLLQVRQRATRSIVHHSSLLALGRDNAASRTKTRGLLHLASRFLKTPISATASEMSEVRAAINSGQPNPAGYPQVVRKGRSIYLDLKLTRNAHSIDVSM